jgi:AraC-like DNA-binding protein
MQSSTRDLLSYLTRLPSETFDLTGRVDDRRYLRRDFPDSLPLLLSVQKYPSYRHMVGENWLHWHDYFEFFVALSGKGDFCAGNDRFFFNPGDVVLVDPLKIHGVMRMEASHSALVILFPRHFIAPTESEIDVSFLSAWEQRSTAALPVMRASHKSALAVHEALLKLVKEWFGSTRRGPEVKLHFMETLLRLRSAFATGETVRSAPPGERTLREARLRKALDYISLHGHETISQPQVAKAAGMSTSRFRQFFKETTGWGFARYLIEQRVVRAARLLRESEETIADIAHRTGFSDQSHLLRCFRAKFGVSPKEYRRTHSTA